VNLDRIDQLAGLVSPAVGRALAVLAAEVAADEVIVEVGSFKGKSTCYLAAGAKAGRGARVVAVDPWDSPGNVSGRFHFAEPATREMFDAQVRSVRLASRVTPLQGFAVDVAASWSGPQVGLLFVDGDHAEESVRADFDAWCPHLASGAVVVFDDYLSPKNPGVKAAVHSLGFDVDVLADWLAVVRVP
jgi:predicted O-methyltransferase YrrM